MSLTLCSSNTDSVINNKLKKYIPGYLLLCRFLILQNECMYKKDLGNTNLTYRSVAAECSYCHLPTFFETSAYYVGNK